MVTSPWLYVLCCDICCSIRSHNGEVPPRWLGHSAHHRYWCWQKHSRSESLIHIQSSCLFWKNKLLPLPWWKAFHTNSLARGTWMFTSRSDSHCVRAQGYWQGKNSTETGARAVLVRGFYVVEPMCCFRANVMTFCLAPAWLGKEDSWQNWSSCLPGFASLLCRHALW